MGWLVRSVRPVRPVRPAGSARLAVCDVADPVVLVVWRRRIWLFGGGEAMVAAVVAWQDCALVRGAG
jgi:hypothetical protein